MENEQRHAKRPRKDCSELATWVVETLCTDRPAVHACPRGAVHHDTWIGGKSLANLHITHASTNLFSHHIQLNTMHVHNSICERELKNGRLPITCAGQQHRDKVY